MSTNFGVVINKCQAMTTTLGARSLLLFGRNSAANKSHSAPCRDYQGPMPFSFLTSAGSCTDDSERQFEDVYEFVDGGKCGSGSSADVFQVRRRSDGGQKLACKIFECNNEEKLLQAINEVAVMKTLEACCATAGGCGIESIATHRDAFVRRTAETGRYRLYLVTDLMRGSDLRAALKQRGSYTEEDARTVMKQLFQALVLMHDVAGVTHRDIKLENLLLPSELDPSKIQLSDFEYSATGTSSKPTMDLLCGSPLYMAPEVLGFGGGLYGNKVDVWSSGVVLFFLLSGYPPFALKSTMHKLLRAIKYDEPNMNDPVWQLISDEAQDFIQKLLTKDPEDRLSAREALLHPWMLAGEQGR